MRHVLVIETEGKPGTTRVLLKQPRVLIGRSSDADVVITDDAVSGHHCALLLDRRRGYVLHDLDSLNGTFVDGERLAAPQVMSAGSEARIGSTRLTLMVDAGRQSPAHSRLVLALAGAAAVLLVLVVILIVYREDPPRRVEDVVVEKPPVNDVVVDVPADVPVDVKAFVPPGGINGIDMDVPDLPAESGPKLRKRTVTISGSFRRGTAGSE